MQWDMVMWRMSSGKVEEFTLHDVFYVPDLAYNLLSMPATAKRNKVTTFSGPKCEIRDADGTKPDVSNLRVLGCSAYAHVPKGERQKQGNVFCWDMVSIKRVTVFMILSVSEPRCHFQ